MTIFLLLSFLFGLVVGSFLNVVILRGVRGESFMRGRSRCSPSQISPGETWEGKSCGKKLAWFELIPLISFAAQKGRCRSCSAALSWQYPLVEFGTGVLFTCVAWIVFKDSSVVILNEVKDLIIFFTIISAAIVIFVSDIRWQIIPNGAIITLLAVALIREFMRFRLYDFVYDVGTALILAFFFFALWFLSKGMWMGFGDVKLILVTSLILGFPASVTAVLFSFWIGGFFGILLLVFKKVNLKTQIPFGPFIILGSVAAFFYTEKLLWYIGLSLG